MSSNPVFWARWVSLGLVALACGGGTTNSGGSETHWLSCANDADCPAGAHCDGKICRKPDGSSVDAATSIVTCSSGPIQVTESGSLSSIGENVSSTCAVVENYSAWKTGAPGTACSNPLDCAPVCCQCSDGSHFAFSTWCDHGVCAPPERVCCGVVGSNLKSCGN
jgi:hypothetical protein